MGVREHAAFTYQERGVEVGLFKGVKTELIIYVIWIYASGYLTDVSQKTS